MIKKHLKAALYTLLVIIFVVIALNLILNYPKMFAITVLVASVCGLITVIYTIVLTYIED